MIQNIPIMSLNGKDIAAFNLVPLEGTYAAIMKPPAYKKIVTNDSSFIHGTLPISTPDSRRLDKQDISLPFFLKSVSMVDLLRETKRLEQELINGMPASANTATYTGVNELRLPTLDLCLRLIYVGMSKYTPWFPSGKAIVTLKFTEPNPNNRAL